MMVFFTVYAKAETFVLNNGWQVQTTDGWIPATVPSTLMGVLTTNGIEPEALTAADYARIDRKQF